MNVLYVLFAISSFRGDSDTVRGVFERKEEVNIAVETTLHSLSL